MPAQAPARLTERAIDSSLLFGLLLIAGGFALGAGAVYLLYPRKATGEGEEMATVERPAPAAEAVSPPSPPEGFPAEGPAELPNAAPPAVPPPIPSATYPVATTEAAVPSPSPRAPSNGEPRMTDQAPPTPPTPEQRLFPVVTLLRDEVTGQLVLQVGTRTYRDPRELRDSSDWTRVEYAARDLARWIEGSGTPRKVEERRPEEKPKPGSMVEQINLILESKLAAQPASGRAVRLVEGADGSVRVYVGVQPYNLDEVPDPAIRAAIREAVAEWEAGR